MPKEMLINVVEGQECRIAIVNHGQLEELYIERVSSASHVGNIYKGRITNVEPSIQAAFVDFGLIKNGFLHISDVNPSYFPKSRKAGSESVGRKRAHRDRPPIQECLRRGQEVVVQLTKEGIGTKGPTLTTYLSVPGRLLVMMPGMSRLGVSRKIEDDEAREKARTILADLHPPDDVGFIVRTAAIDRSKRDFQRDLNYLLRLWKNIKQRINTTKAPVEIYQESDLVTRTIRDVYNADIERIVCDNESVAYNVREFLDVALPRGKNLIELYVGNEGLFHDYGLEQEIEKIYSRRIELPSGGSLVFDQAEALVAIDVNSGRFREHTDAETTATRVNQEAAREIARQLRLRDLGGVVIIDFIDMREDKNRRLVEKTLRDEMRGDRAKTKIQKISMFGIVEMTRQRVRPSLKQSIFHTCPHCEGTGFIKTEESISLLVMRSLQRAISNEQIAQVEVAVTPPVAEHLANCERKRIADLESASGKKILVKADPTLAGSAVRISCTNSRGASLSMEQLPKPAGEQRKLKTVALPPRATPPDISDEDLFAESQEELFEELPVESETQPQTEAGPLFEEPQSESAEDIEWPFKDIPDEVQPTDAGEATESQPAVASTEPPATTEILSAASAESGADAAAAPGETGKPRRRRRGGRGRRKKDNAAQPAATSQPAAAESSAAPTPTPTPDVPSSAPALAAAAVEAATQEPSATAAAATGENGEQPPAKKSRRRGRRGGKRHKRHTGDEQAANSAAANPSEQGGQPQSKPSSEPTATAAQPAKVVEVKPKAGVHRQDKEYYEDRIREAKESARKPRDYIPDEDDDDFSRE